MTKQIVSKNKKSSNELYRVLPAVGDFVRIDKDIENKYKHKLHKTNALWKVVSIDGNYLNIELNFFKARILRLFVTVVNSR